MRGYLEPAASQEQAARRAQHEQDRLLPAAPRGGRAGRGAARGTCSRLRSVKRPAGTESGPVAVLTGGISSLSSRHGAFGDPAGRRGAGRPAPAASGRRTGARGAGHGRLRVGSGAERTGDEPVLLPGRRRQGPDLPARHGGRLQRRQPAGAERALLRPPLPRRERPGPLRHEGDQPDRLRKRRIHPLRRVLQAQLADRLGRIPGRASGRNTFVLPQLHLRRNLDDGLPRRPLDRDAAADAARPQHHLQGRAAALRARKTSPTSRSSGAPRKPRPTRRPESCWRRCRQAPATSSSTTSPTTRRPRRRKAASCSAPRRRAPASRPGRNRRRSKSRSPGRPTRTPRKAPSRWSSPRRPGSPAPSRRTRPAAVQSTLVLEAEKSATPGKYTVTVDGYVDKGEPSEKHSSVQIPLEITEPFILDPLGDYPVARCTPDDVPIRIAKDPGISDPIQVDVYIEGRQPPSSSAPRPGRSSAHTTSARRSTSPATKRQMTVTVGMDLDAPGENSPIIVEVGAQRLRDPGIERDRDGRTDPTSTRSARRPPSHRSSASRAP